MPFRSPGAASEMSGTTAISSFSLVEAESLESKYIIKHMRKLCDVAEEFLEYLAPDDGGIDDDLRNIKEIQKPDSDFTEDYRDYEKELNVHLGHYKNEQHNYIHVRTLHRALFGPDRDVAAAQSGLDLILFLTNLLVFAKQMIHSDRNAKDTWDALRQLDNSFPSHFMRSLASDTDTTGGSALFKETFDLALELRTQLAIMVLGRTTGGNDLNPDETIGEVFFHSESSQAAGDGLIRGWGVLALGSDDAALPQHLQEQVIDRISKIREYFPMDNESLEHGNTVDVEGLGAQFPWVAVVLRLLHWVRLRHRELRSAIDNFGGAVAIVRNVKQAIDELQTDDISARIEPVVQDLPRTKRISFGRDRRRSSRKFDPHAPVDPRIIDALKAKERESGVGPDLGGGQEQEDEVIAPVIEKPQDDDIVGEAVGESGNDVPVVESQQSDWQPVLEEEQEQFVEQQIEEVEEQVEEPVAQAPPQSSAALLKLLKAVSEPQKENRPVSIFDRNSTAQRVEFGDGFGETQPTPGPSNTSIGKQTAQPSSRKRSRPDDSDEDSDDDAFETEERGSRVHAQRQKAPVTKKVRIDPTSSGAPPSHQPPPPQVIDEEVVTRRQEREQESFSEGDAPDMTEEAPPPSSYAAQYQLAKQNRIFQPIRKERKTPQGWSEVEEEAFMAYMGRYPSKFATILQYDKDQGGELLQERTQVNLKDKARTMAINMIK